MPLSMTSDTTLSWSETKSRTGKATTTTAGRTAASRRGGPPRSVTTRPRTAASTVTNLDNQRIICAISESRSVLPMIGVAFVNLDTWEAVLSQICDSQTYTRTIHKLFVYKPTEVLFSVAATKPKSKLFSIVEENLDKYNISLKALDRAYFSESEGLDYVQQLAYISDVEAIKISVQGNLFAICSFAAALKYIEVGLTLSFPFHSLRIKYEPPEGSMMIDMSTISSLELVQNLHNPNSNDCLCGHLRETQTPMGARLLKSNILQPLTSSETIEIRLDAVEEFTRKEQLFLSVRQALKGFIVDADRVLSSMLVIVNDPNLVTIENSINNVISLRQFVQAILPVYEALYGVQSTLLVEIRRLCSPMHVNPVNNLIETVINEDIKYSKSPLDLRNQRTFAVRAGVNGLLDVSRQAYKENSDDVLEYVAQLHERHGLQFELKYDSMRQYHLRLPRTALEGRTLPSEFVNVIRAKDKVECSTLDLLKLNQKIVESHNECIAMSDETVEALVNAIRPYAGSLFKMSESIAMLDMISAFAHIATMQEHVRPVSQSGFSIKGGRHPIKEKVLYTEFVPNDVSASDQSRMQIITGCNLSGKSTYIRMVALLTIMRQIGSFVPASHAGLPIKHQLFARISVDDSAAGNISTFATEMQEMAFILQHVNARSLVIVDELGRGTSTRDGMAIAIAISEALIDSHAYVWFVTHFVDLARILAERVGVMTLHLAVETPNPNTTHMTYNLSKGPTPSLNYGISLARMVSLPAGIIPRATAVAKYLEDKKTSRSTTPAAMIMQRRRRLLLDLKSDLEQAHNSNMPDQELVEWLVALRSKFVLEMDNLTREMVPANDNGFPETTYPRSSVPSDVARRTSPIQTGANPETAIIIDDVADMLTEDWSSSED